MNEVVLVLEMDSERRVFRARGESVDLVVEGPSRAELSQKMCDTVRSELAAELSFPASIHLRYDTGQTIETIVLRQIL